MGPSIGDAAARISVFQLLAELALLAAMVMASSWLVRGWGWQAKAPAPRDRPAGRSYWCDDGSHACRHSRTGPVGEGCSPPRLAPSRRGAHGQHGISPPQRARMPAALEWPPQRQSAPEAGFPGRAAGAPHLPARSVAVPKRSGPDAPGAPYGSGARSNPRLSAGP